MSIGLHEPSVPSSTRLTHASPRFRRFSPKLAATVESIDLRQPLSESLRETLRAGLREYGVLFFRDQQLSPQQFLEAASIFGEPLRHNPYLPSLEDNGGVEIIESGSAQRLANESWHADVTWQRDPPKATALYASQLPPFGGDTVWASSTAAYEGLDPLLRAYFDTLTATNFVDANGNSRRLDPDGDDEQRLRELRAKYPPIDVPVITTHPETGQKAIFVNELHTKYIKGVARSISDSLLRILFSALEDPVVHARFT